MAAAERVARHSRDAQTVTYHDAIVIGLTQIGALIPGVSRSGPTLTAALFLGLKREDAARVSFLLGIPDIALAGGRELWLLAHLGLPREAWYVLAVGLAVSSASAFLRFGASCAFSSALQPGRSSFIAQPLVSCSSSALRFIEFAEIRKALAPQFRYPDDTSNSSWRALTKP